MHRVMWKQEESPYSQNLFQNPSLLRLILSLLFFYLLLCPVLHLLTLGFLSQLSTSSAHWTLTRLSSRGVTSLKVINPNQSCLAAGMFPRPLPRSHVHL